MPGDQEEGSDLGRGARSVAQADPQVPRGGDRVGVERHPPRRGERLFDRDGGNNGRPQGHHGAELALGDEADRRRAEPQAQQGIGGMRVRSAEPAMPEGSASHPAKRPITSTTITRSWLSAVEWSLSIASVAVWTAVSNPNVATVPPTSLSMVLGTPTTGTPFRW